MGRRATKLDRQFRIATFVQMLSRGHVNSELVDFAEREWGEAHNAFQYIKEAVVIIHDVDTIERKSSPVAPHQPGRHPGGAAEGGAGQPIVGMNVIIRWAVWSRTVTPNSGAAKGIQGLMIDCKRRLNDAADRGQSLQLPPVRSTDECELSFGGGAMSIRHRPSISKTAAFATRRNHQAICANR